jgi:formate hydrogenlyase subunit 4
VTASLSATVQSLLSALGALGVLFVFAPLVPGVARKTRAILTGRRGPPVWQLYADLWKLARKGAVYSVTTTWIFRLTPLVTLAATLLASAVIPLDGKRALLSFSGDAVAFAGFLALARYFMVLGAMDTGSSFEGMGASRDVTFASLVEPGLFVAFVALSVASGGLSLSNMLGADLWLRWSVVAPTIVLLAGSVFLLMLAECARVPVDDPTTHLELTMIHEVMVLDSSGPDLALILYGQALKLSLFAAILIDLVLPRSSLPAWGAMALLGAGLTAVGIAVGIVESTMARLRLPKVPLFIASGAALGLFGLILLMR